MTINTISDKFIADYDIRLIPQIPPEGSPLDTDGEYSLMITSARWKAHITGMVQRLTELSAWVGDDDAVLTAIENIHAWLAQEGSMNCNDVNDCLPLTDAFTSVQRSINQQTMTTASNANATRKKIYANAGNSKTAVNSLAKNYVNKNDQTTINIMCVAIDHFVRDFVARMKDALGLARTVGYVANALTTFALTVAGSFEPLLGVAGGAVLYLIDYANDELDAMIAAFADEPAIDEVICCMQGYMNLRANNYSNYQSMLASDCYAADSHAEKIAYYIELYCSNEDIWLYWIDLLATTELCTIASDCECVAPDDCTGLTVLEYYPDTIGMSITSATSYDSRLTFSSNTVIGQIGGLWFAQLSTNGWMDIELSDSPYCLKELIATIRRSASGTGTPSFVIYVNGVEVRRNASATAYVAGTTYANSVINFQTEAGVQVLERGSVVRFVSNELTPTATWSWALRLPYIRRYTS